MIQSEPQPPRERADFKEASLPKEPKSDVKLTLDDGTILRERMRKIPSENGGYSLVLTSVKLDKKDVVSSEVAPPHEIVLTGEALARLGSPEKIREAIDDARKEAAAAARDHFRGLEMGEQVLAERLS